MQKSKKNYWGIVEKGVSHPIMEGSFSECWSYYVETFGSLSVTEAAGRAKITRIG